jgi:uncharacterized delta-60 repeat protein
LSGTGFVNGVYAIDIDTNLNRLYAGGLFNQYNGTNVFGFTALDLDNGNILGTPFNTTLLNEPVNDIFVQNDSKVLLGGEFTTYSGVSQNRLTRINSNGFRDTSFNIGTGFNNTVEIVMVDTNNKVLVGGEFTQFNGNNKGGLVRLNSDGSLDTTFSGLTTGFSGATPIPFRLVNEILEYGGKYYVSGNWSTYNGSPVPDIVRLNQDGSLDTTFSAITYSAATRIIALGIQSTGKIIVSDDTNMRRLNTDGSLDLTFTTSSVSPEANTIEILGDDKILAGGRIFGVGIRRYNVNGGIDTTFNPPTMGIVNQVRRGVNSIVVANGCYFIAGDWFSIDNTVSLNIARLFDNGSLNICSPTQLPSPTPTRTPTQTPTNTSTTTQTPTQTTPECECFSALTYSYSGVPFVQPIIIAYHCDGSEPLTIVANGSDTNNIATRSCIANGGFTSYSASTYAYNISLSGCCGPDVTNTPTPSTTQNLTPTPTPTNTSTPTQTQTSTPTQTQTSTQGLTPTQTPTNTETPTQTPTPTPSGELVTCIQIIDTVIAPVPQSGPNNFFGVNVALDPYPVTENVTVTGYIREVSDPSNRYDFSITIIGGTQSGETANNVLMTGPADSATIVVTGVTPTTVTYNGNSVYICGFEPEPTPTQTPTQTQTGTPASTQGLSPTPTTTATPTPSVTSTLEDLSLTVEQRTGDPDFTEIWVTVENGETFTQNLSFDWSVDVSPAGSSSGTATITIGQNEVYLTGFDPNVEVFVNASLSNVTPNPIDGYNILV